jgi:hypothetical protein
MLIFIGLQPRSMEMKILKTKPLFLPVYIKWVGVIIILLALIHGVLMKALNVEMQPDQKELFRIFTMNAFILGLLFIALSRDRFEDERIISVRVKALAWAFIWAVIYVIVSPFIDLLFKDPVEDLSGQQVVMSMLLIYLLMFYLQKKGMKKV